MNGALVGITAGRRADEQASLVRSLGGVPIVGSVLMSTPRTCDNPAADAVVQVLERPIDDAVFMTGIGTRLVFETAGALGALPAFVGAVSRACVFVRGTKARAALRTHGITWTMTADPPLSSTIRDELLRLGVRGRRILIQADGGDDEPLVHELIGLGASVIHARPYRSEPPADLGPAEDLIRRVAAGELDALTFTSAQAAQAFELIAGVATIDISTLATGRTLIVSVGPVTSDALRAAGLPVHVEPDTPRMGAMYRALARRLAPRRPPDAESQVGRVHSVPGLTPDPKSCDALSRASARGSGQRG